MTALHSSAHSIVKFLTVQRYILCIYLANFLPIFFEREMTLNAIHCHSMLSNSPTFLALSKINF